MRMPKKKINGKIVKRINGLTAIDIKKKEKYLSDEYVKILSKKESLRIAKKMGYTVKLEKLRGTYYFSF